MEITVLKLGGSILCGPEDLERIADVVESEINAGRLPVCVVSAMKGVTDKVITALGQVRTESFDPKAFTSELMNAHMSCLPAMAETETLRREFEKLEHVLSYVCSSGARNSLSPRRLRAITKWSR